MTDDLPPADSVRDGDEGIWAADERAMTDLFASLVADAPASEVSPLDVVRLGRREAREALDTRIRRFKVLRNVLVAAAFAALVVLIVPHLGSGSSSSTAASSAGAASVPAAAASAVRQPAGSAPARSGAAVAGGGAAGSAASDGGSSGGAAAGSAPAGSAAAAGSDGSNAGSTSAAAGSTSAAAASAAMTSGAPAPAPAPGAAPTPDSAKALSASGSAASAAGRSGPVTPGTESVVPCPPLTARSVGAVRSAFPAGYLGPAAAGSGCRTHGAAGAGTGASLAFAAHPAAKLTVTAVRAAPGACRPVGCELRSGTTDVYEAVPAGPSGGIRVWVYGNGDEVMLRTSGTFAGAPSAEQLVAAGRAVIRTLG